MTAQQIKQINQRLTDLSHYLILNFGYWNEDGEREYNTEDKNYKLILEEMHFLDGLINNK